MSEDGVEGELRWEDGCSVGSYVLDFEVER